jgi:outer membrane protein assembly complex protein YaeT
MPSAAPARVLLIALACASGRVAWADEPPEALIQPPALNLPESEIALEGTFIDDRARLERFLGLQPGRKYPASELQRILEDLRLRLGYRLVDDRREGGIQYLKIEPFRVVRKLVVRGGLPGLGAFPLFDDEILRYLTVTSGSRLDLGDKTLEAFLDDEAARVTAYLQREGYFGGSARIIPEVPRDADWVDLVVRVDLGGWLRPFRLGSVLLDGPHAVTASDLYDTFSSHLPLWWGRFTLSGMRDDARTAEKKLRESGYPAARVIPDFDAKRDVDQATRRVKLPVRVNEKRHVTVRFLGNRALSDRELKEQLTIFTAGAYDEIELSESARAMQRTYQQHGYFESKVTFRRKRASPSEEEITFLIDEGPELRVREVEVAGEGGAALTFTSEALKTAADLQTKVFPRLGVIGLGTGGYITTVQLQQDVERLVEYYKSQGFPQAKARGEAARDPDAFGALGALGAAVAGDLGRKRDLYVRFFVEEGHRELIDHVEVDFEGPHLRTREEVLGVLRQTNGKPYTEPLLLEDAQRVADALYKASAHPYVHVDYLRSSWNATHDRYVVRYHIIEGAEVRFGEILVRGNFKTRSRVILGDLPFKPGDKFDLAKLLEGERNLGTHGLFNSARVVPVGLSQMRNPVPILVSVQEREMSRFGSVVLGAGVATDRLPYYVYLMGQWQWNNVFGFGSQLEVRADTGFSADSWGASGRYTDLRVFGPGWRFDLNSFYRREVTNRFGKVASYGGSIGLARYLTPTLRLFGRWDLYVTALQAAFFRVDGSNDQQFFSDNTVTSKLVFGAFWDRRVNAEGRPDMLAPVKGWLLQGGVSWATPYLGGDHQFLVFTGEAQWLRPFHLRTAEFAFIADLRFDEGIPIGEPSLPVVERFFAGGDSTTRGYDNDMLKNEVIRGDVAPLGGQSGFRVVPQGGNIRILSRMDLQFPISKSFLGLVSWPWAGSIFYDVGAIFDAPNLVKWSDFRHAIGVSLLRVLTPFGPLSFEYAYPLSPTQADERWKTNPWYSHFPGRLHFNWGIPIRVF